MVGYCCSRGVVKPAFPNYSLVQVFQNNNCDRRYQTLCILELEYCRASKNRTSHRHNHCCCYKLLGKHHRGALRYNRRSVISKYHFVVNNNSHVLCSADRKRKWISCAGTKTLPRYFNGKSYLLLLHQSTPE